MRLLVLITVVALTGCRGVAPSAPPVNPTHVVSGVPSAVTTLLPTPASVPPVVAHRVAPPVRHSTPRPVFHTPQPVPVASAGTIQIALINADRARNGLSPYFSNGCLIASAQHSAALMAAQGFISESGYTANLACGLHTGLIGENVGWTTLGVQDSALNTLFMNSPPHRANILGAYRYIGTAWAVSRTGAGYIAVEFA